MFVFVFVFVAVHKLLVITIVIKLKQLLTFVAINRENFAVKIICAVLELFHL